MDDLARLRAEAADARRLADTYPSDRMYRHQADAAERALEVAEATAQRERERVASEATTDIEARLARVEADIDHIAAAVDLIARTFDKLVTRKDLQELGEQVARLEALWRSLPDPSASISPHDRRSAN